MDTPNNTTKLCPRCKKDLPLTAEYFNRCSRSPSGLRAECKECRKPDTRSYYERNTEKMLAYTKQWHKDNYAKAYGYAKKSRSNPERRKALNAKTLAWQHANLERVRETGRKSGKKHCLKRRLKARTRNARIKQAEGSFTRMDIVKIFEEQDHRCAYCGITLYLEIKGDTHVDHYHPIFRGGSNYPDNLRCTCENCNLSKGSKTYEEWVAWRGW